MTVLFKALLSFKNKWNKNWFCGTCTWLSQSMVGKPSAKGVFDIGTTGITPGAFTLIIKSM